MSTAQTIITCPECPKSFSTGFQNTNLLGTLFFSIAERFSKILEQIDEEAGRAEREGLRKRFRLVGLNGENSNGGDLHDGGEGCREAFSLELSPGEWRTMCKKVVRTEVVGPESLHGAESGGENIPNESNSGQGRGNGHHPYFLGLAKQMEERQDQWHKMPLPEDFPKHAKGILRPADGKACEKKAEGQQSHQCLAVVGSSKKLVASFDWS